MLCKSSRTCGPEQAAGSRQPPGAVWLDPKPLGSCSSASSTGIDSPRHCSDRLSGASRAINNPFLHQPKVCTKPLLCSGHSANHHGDSSPQPCRTLHVLLIQLGSRDSGMEKASRAGIPSGSFLSFVPQKRFIQCWDGTQGLAHARQVLFR